MGLPVWQFGIYTADYMYHHLVDLFRGVRFSRPLLVAWAVYLVLTLPAVAGSHFLFNLEPYPDGLYYLGQSVSLSRGDGLALTYNTTKIESVVPPGYSLFLLPFFSISTWPAMFYLGNVVAGIITLGSLSYIARRIRRVWWLEVIVLFAYLSHGYSLWLAGVPMAENLALMILSLCCLCLIQPKMTGKRALIVLSLIGWLVLTKYAYIMTAIGLGGLLFWQIFSQKRWRVGAWLVGITIMISVGGWIWLESRGVKPFSAFSIAQFGQASTSGITYYAWSNVASNLRIYGAGLLSQPATFLWMRWPLSSWAMTVVAGWGIWLAWKSREEVTQRLAVMLSVLFMVSWPLFALFYVQDSRYLIFIIFYWAIGAGLWLTEVKLGRLRWLILGIVVIAQIWAQLPIYKQILANNLLHRSVAWQYEAIKVFDEVIPTTSANQIITALPPFLVEMYQSSEYQVLPLSRQQEFISKGQYVWGTPPLANDLLDEYQRRLEAGQQLLISNAYITHQAPVVADFERYRERFQLIPVASGCLDACNLYQLELKTSINE